MRRVQDKPPVWLEGEIKTPPFGREARIEAGFLLRRLQCGERLSMPQARPMPVIGRRCLELRIVDLSTTWRVLVRTDPDAVIIAGVLQKKTQKTPQHWIEMCRRRLREYDDACD
jgi:phage-related protein